MIPSPTALIETRQLSRAVAATPTPLLVPTDFTLHAGECVAITGSSGSGKSVFLRMLALLDAPDGGELHWKGQPVTAATIPTYRSNVCYLAQRPALLDGTVLDNLQLPFRLKVRRQHRFDLEAVHALLGKADKPLAFLDKPGADLSGGEAQIVALIRVLQLQPQVLLFDEPTSALDPQSAATVETLVLDWLRTDGQARACVWVSHDRAQALRMGTRHLQMTQGTLHAEAER